MRDCEFPILMEMAGHSCTCDFSQARDSQQRADWLQELARACSAGAQISCQCPGSGARRLRLDSDGCLGREPGTGGEHAPACVFHFPPLALSGMDRYGAGIQPGGASGEWCLQVGPVINCPLEGFQQAAEHSPPLFSLRALLGLLWVVSGLNGWSPAVQPRRTVRGVHDQLQKAAQEIGLDRYPLADYLLLGTPGVKEQKRTNRDRAGKALERRYPFLALVPLAAWSEAREQAADGMLPLTDFDGIPALSCPSARWSRALHESPFIREAWQGGERVVALVLAVPQLPRLAMAERLVLMPISSAWVPLHSAQERRMEAELRDRQRSFWRPMGFAGEAPRQLPDFWLEEGGQYPVPILVQP